uniref:Protein C45G7.4 n=1 Tax=Haemonchus contortus TaxID=6289 RepID=W6NMH1_HAECO
MPHMPHFLPYQCSYRSSHQLGSLDSRECTKRKRNECDSNPCAGHAASSTARDLSTFYEKKRNPQQNDVKDTKTFTCLECCVNMHNGHTLLSMSQLQAEQLKVLGELRELRRRLVDALSSTHPVPKGWSGEDVKDLLFSTSRETLQADDETLTKLDSAIQMVESSTVICPKKLSELRNEQIHQCSRFLTRKPLHQEALGDVLEKSDGEKDNLIL